MRSYVEMLKLAGIFGPDLDKPFVTDPGKPSYQQLGNTPDWLRKAVAGGYSPWRPAVKEFPNGALPPSHNRPASAETWTSQPTEPAAPAKQPAAPAQVSPSPAYGQIRMTSMPKLDQAPSGIMLGGANVPNSSFDTVGQLSLGSTPSSSTGRPAQRKPYGDLTGTDGGRLLSDLKQDVLTYQSGLNAFRNGTLDSQPQGSMLGSGGQRFLDRNEQRASAYQRGLNSYRAQPRQAPSGYTPGYVSIAERRRRRALGIPIPEQYRTRAYWQPSPTALQREQAQLASDRRRYGINSDVVRKTRQNVQSRLNAFDNRTSGGNFRNWRALKAPMRSDGTWIRNGRTDTYVPRQGSRDRYNRPVTAPNIFRR